MNGFSAVAIAGVDSACARQVVLARLQPVDALLGQHRAGAGQDRDRVEHVAGDHRDAHVQLEVALGAGDGHGGVVADHLRGHLEHHLGDHRVDLAGHDRRALLQLGQRQLDQPGARARAHDHQVVGDLGQRHGHDLQRAATARRARRGCPGPRTGPRARPRPGRWPRTAWPAPSRRSRRGCSGRCRWRCRRAGSAARAAARRTRARRPAGPARRSRRTPARASPGPRPSCGCGRP